MQSESFNQEYFSSAAYADYQSDVLAYAGAVGRKIASFIQDRPQPRVLDVGCAHGYLIGWLKEKYGFEAAGLGLSDYVISRGEKAVKNQIKKGSILAGRNFKPNSFDAVFCQDVCEYLERRDIDAAAGNLVSWSRGYVFFGDIYKHSIKASQKFNPDPYRLTSLSQKEYIGLFKKAGAEYISKFNGCSGGDIMIFEKE